MDIIAFILTKLLYIYMWILIAFVVVSWLVAFNVLDARNPKGRQIMELLQKLTDPVLKPIQRAVPPIAGIDLSPFIAFIAIELLIGLIWRLAV